MVFMPLIAKEMIKCFTYSLSIFIHNMYLLDLIGLLY